MYVFSTTLSDGLSVPGEGMDRAKNVTGKEDTELISFDPWSRNSAMSSDDRLQRFPRLDQYTFIPYMNATGWPQGGVFTTLLSTVGYGLQREQGRMVFQRETMGRAAESLTCLIFELLPFHVLLGDLPEVPVEIWEHIIDCINNDLLTRTRELCACTLVCRLWHTRAKLRLYENVDLDKHYLSKFQTVVRKYPKLPLASTKSMMVRCGRRPISGFLTIYKFKNLKELRIGLLDLTREHLPVTKGPIFRTVTHLLLEGMYSCTVSNILRFINFFQSLAELGLHCDAKSPFQHKGGVLSPPRSASVPRLRRLELQMVPGVDELIKWYIQEGHFLQTLEVLHLTSDIKYDQPSPEYHAWVNGCTALLGHCAGALKDLKFGTMLPNGSPLLDEVARIVVLSSFPNLRRMEWRGRTFQFAAAQISLVCEPLKTVEDICLRIGGRKDNEYEEEKDYCTIIDKALAGDNFPSLRLVVLKKGIPWDYFPILKSRNLLEAMEY